MPEVKKNILVIEDDPDLVRLLQDALEGEGYAVSLALDWHQAQSHLQKTVPDLVVLDILLPGASGFEVLRRLKSNPATKNVAVIILSNLGQEQEIRAGLEQGAADYLVKADISIDQVVQKVRQALKAVKNE